MVQRGAVKKFEGDVRKFENEALRTIYEDLLDGVNIEEEIAEYSEQARYIIVRLVDNLSKDNIPDILFIKKDIIVFQKFFGSKLFPKTESSHCGYDDKTKEPIWRNVIDVEYHIGGGTSNRPKTPLCLEIEGFLTKVGFENVDIHAKGPSTAVIRFKNTSEDDDAVVLEGIERIKKSYRKLIGSTDIAEKLDLWTKDDKIKYLVRELLKIVKKPSLALGGDINKDTCKLINRFPMCELFEKSITEDGKEYIDLTGLLTTDDDYKKELCIGTEDIMENLGFDESFLELYEDKDHPGNHVFEYTFCNDGY
ncbi:MAG: hypothetical protein ACRC5M_06865 [Anaeroplasmataceae bacterium]